MKTKLEMAYEEQHNLMLEVNKYACIECEGHTDRMPERLQRPYFAAMLAWGNASRQDFSGSAPAWREVQTTAGAVHMDKDPVSELRALDGLLDAGKVPLYSGRGGKRAEEAFAYGWRQGVAAAIDAIAQHPNFDECRECVRELRETGSMGMGCAVLRAGLAECLAVTDRPLDEFFGTDDN